MKKFIVILITLCMILSVLPTASAEEAAPVKLSGIYVQASPENEHSRIRMQTAEGKNYIFLPSPYDVTALPIYFTLSREVPVSAIGKEKAVEITSGQTVDLPQLCGKSEEYVLTLTADTASVEVHILPIGNVAAMYLVSDDPVGHGREWVEISYDKTNKATGSLLMTDEAGQVVYDGVLTQIKGRGNSTWLADKKPYQIKLDSKTDLLQTGNKDNKAKTWVLLTNHADETLIRNNLVYDMSVAVGMKPGIESEPVSLFYDGEYRGAYLLCEKVEINTGRIEITDLEKATEKANPAIEDFDALKTLAGKTANGASYIYCEGVVSPKDVTGGYLLEMETAARAVQEKCYFITSRGNYVVVKSPEYASKEEMDYIASYYQEFEDAVYNKGVNPGNGKSVEAYATMESLAQCYIVNEFTKNPDGYRTSTYLYKDANNDVMTVGPIWDYDLSFGLSFGEFVTPCRNPEEFFTLHCAFTRALYEIPAFRQAVHDLYLNEFSPRIDKVLLGDAEDAAPMQSIDSYAAEIAPSALANGKVWGRSQSSWSANTRDLKSYIQTRNAWLTKAFGTWSAENNEELPLYIDVLKADWYYEAIMRASDYGIMNGMGSGVFSPAGLTTRAQGTKVLYALSGAEAPAIRSLFTDVTASDWYAAAILWGYDKGVVKGYDDRTFRPEEQITRQDMVVLLYRYLGSPAVTGNLLAGYKDQSSVLWYARDAVEWALETGMLKGYEDTTIRPVNQINRAELATLMVRYYETYLNK